MVLSMADHPNVEIHYRRPPDDTQLFIQPELYRDEDVIVTYLDRTPLTRTSRVRGRPILEDGSPVVWFTFPGVWHDIARFHRVDGTFTGIYANILTPVTFIEPRVWDTTDLFLDLWLEPGHAPLVLDRDEFDEALELGWIDDSTARSALEETERLLELTATGEWPPPVVEEWTLERAREVAMNSHSVRETP